MKKILVPEDIKALLDKDESFLKRSDTGIYTFSSHDKALDIHKSERANLIITRLDMSGLSSEEFCSLIRKDKELRKVSIILLHNNTPPEIEISARCMANLQLPAQIDPALLLDKSLELLDIAKREHYRVLLSARVDGSFENRTFFCRLENISVSGMLLESEKLLSKGDVITCAFFLPNSQHIRVRGEIVRVAEKAAEYDSNQYGVRFVDLEEELRSSIAAFIEKRGLSS